ncbi:flagellar motor protein MotB [Thaumasiovibrio sp. DFM-14]|uniref:flagellar motor protein MotB n=1 Tax=Thaumasiovibrio sp. DFM-14 TaxID=3384792 RepID=UPI0039A29BD5
MDSPVKCKCKPGAPQWMATFADLATLLMCFFVLLLSFSEMDVLKFRQIAGSMKFAFGVQNALEVKDIPKGTSVIAQEFRPGRPEPTPIEVIMQQTIDMTKRSLDFHEGEMERARGMQRDVGKLAGGQVEVAAPRDNDSQDIEQAQRQRQLADVIENALQRDIAEGTIELELLGQQLVIRIKEQGAFASGSAFLQPKFRPLVRQIALLVSDVPGEVTIMGHTDSSPFDSELYRSNWDLSAQRAVSVAQEMESVRGFDHRRLRVIGMADTAPLSDSTTEEGQRINRRVEIAIQQGKPHYSDPVSSQNDADR